MTDLRKVDVNLIVVLDAILSEKNLTRAGELVGMTQPSVSGALARLRQQFDDPLLIRAGRGFELTPKALELVPLVEEAMGEISRVYDLSPTFDPATSTRTFLISASDYLLSQLTGPLLRILEDVAPQINIECDALPADANVSPNDLLRRDVVISGTGRGVPGKRQSLFSDRFVCIVDRGNERLLGGKLTTNDLQEMQHVRSFFGSAVQTHVDDMLSSAGITPRIAMSVQGFLPVPHTVSGTRFVGFVPERLAAQSADTLGLVVAETELPSAILVEAAHWHPSKNGDPAIQWLVKLLRDASEVVEFGDAGFDSEQA
jgi:LysR family nod box-dependent transcriptional activator